MRAFFTEIIESFRRRENLKLSKAQFFPNFLWELNENIVELPPDQFTLLHIKKTNKKILENHSKNYEKKIKKYNLF